VKGRANSSLSLVMGLAYTTAMNLAEWGIMRRLLSVVTRFELDFAGPYMMYGFNRLSY
jgi:hypothetical protein